MKSNKICLLLLTIHLFIISVNAETKNSDVGPSQTLPILYINVYNEDGASYNNEIIDRNLSHKNYFTGEYWLNLNGCEWMQKLGVESIGSSEKPLPLEIKARGNSTRIGFSKKPFKLKLGKKQNLLGLSNSKHFALLAHADDHFGFLRNFTGFNLGKRIGLPWTPWQQPVEVVINGDYRGLYFLTESIRVEEERVNITKLSDFEENPELISGGYIVELDNYFEDNHTSIWEKSCVTGHKIRNIPITWDSPENYSEIQQRFILEQFTAINDLIGANSDDLWKYLDMDDAVRYYLVVEIISHVESYCGSTYLFRDYGENQKWHFSPLWDCGHAFDGQTDSFLYDCDPYGNYWIPSIRNNEKFNEKLYQTWIWFMKTHYNGIIDDIDEYVEHIRDAAKCDHLRWDGAPRPENPDFPNKSWDVVDNSDMDCCRDRVVNHLNAKINWLKTKFGDYSLYSNVAEPERDETPAQPLPEYAKTSFIEMITDQNNDHLKEEIYNLQGIRISKPIKGQIYIKRIGNKSQKILYFQ